MLPNNYIIISFRGPFHFLYWTDNQAGISFDFIDCIYRCRETKGKSPVLVGGVKVDEAVASLFAALVWHCQSLREDLDKFCKCNAHHESAVMLINSAIWLIFGCNQG